MAEKANAVTFKGNALTLVGEEVSVGQDAPDFEVVSTDLNSINFPSDFSGKVCVICSVPSLDTPVCDLEMRRFNDEVSGLGDDVSLLAISMDLPFAQGRWCGAAEADNVQAGSDYKEADFGKAYGVLIKELRLLARSVFVVDRNGVIRYKELVKEITNEPDYKAALEAVKSLL